LGSDGIRLVPESGKIWQTSPDSGDTVPDSGQTGRSGQVSGNSAGIPAVLAESPSSPAGILPERRDPGQEGRFPVNWPRSGRFLPDSSKEHWNPAKMARFRQLCRNLYLPNIKKNIFILFYINIFYFVNNFFLINMIKLKYKKYL
jgi:hypothetical protein